MKTGRQAVAPLSEIIIAVGLSMMPCQCTTARCPATYINRKGEGMQPSQRRIRLPIPHSAWLLVLIVLAGLSGCGPASSGDSANVESHAGRTGPSPSGQAQVSASAPIISAAIPVPLASNRSPAGHANARLADPLVMPELIAMALKSSDTQVRLRALNLWVQQEHIGSVDPLLLTLKLIAQNGAQAAKKSR